MKSASNPQIQAGIKKEAAVVDQIWQAIMDLYGDAPMVELAALLAILRAEAWIHQAHHWQTRGCSYYGDHLLFERLYNDTNAFVDGLAEKTVGTGHHTLVNPVFQGQHMLSVLQALYAGAPPNPSAEEYAMLSLRTVYRFLAVERLVYEALKAKGQLSHGIDNMLQGIADKHEEFVYLLKQRTMNKNASVAPNASQWKAAHESPDPKAVGGVIKLIDQLIKAAENAKAELQKEGRPLHDLGFLVGLMGGFPKMPEFKALFR